MTGENYDRYERVRERFFEEEPSLQPGPDFKFEWPQDQSPWEEKFIGHGMKLDPGTGSA